MVHVADGTIVGAFDTKAKRKAAYALLSHPAVTLEALNQAAWRACARRAQDFPFVYVPVDGSSISLRDPHKTRGTGPVGRRSNKGRGFLYMNAIAVSPGGAALGICGQSAWTRGERRAKTPKAKRKFKQKETHQWIEVCEQVSSAFEQEGECTPWFQLDRGGDAGDVLLYAVENGWLITVRAAQNRRLVTDGERIDLWSMLEQKPVLGQYFLPVTQGEKRTARIATMRVRASSVTLRLRNKWTKTVRQVTLGAVLAREEGTVPEGEKPLEWMLLTTASLSCWAEVQRVIEGYCHRWKIEQFHRLWKSEHCDVEATCLHESSRILKWSAILSSVAMRVLQLTQQSRTEPESPASTLLSKDEIEALIVLRNKPEMDRDQIPTLAQAVRWIAELGGFMGRGKGVPPGATVIGRGLEKLGMAVATLQALRQMKSARNKGARKKSV